MEKPGYYFSREGEPRKLYRRSTTARSALASQEKYSKGVGGLLNRAFYVVPDAGQLAVNEAITIWVNPILLATNPPGQEGQVIDKHEQFEGIQPVSKEGE